MMESPELVSRLGLGLETRLGTIFASLGLESFRSRLCLEGCRSRSRAYCFRLLLLQRYGLGKFL